MCETGAKLLRPFCQYPENWSDQSMTRKRYACGRAPEPVTSKAAYGRLLREGTQPVISRACVVEMSAGSMKA